MFKFASDVNVDQTTEIARMQKMLADVVAGPPAIAIQGSSTTAPPRTQRSPSCVQCVLPRSSLADCRAASLGAQQDPRVGLKAGLYDAASASWNMNWSPRRRRAEKFVERDQLRPGVPRQLRHPGQLQRLPGVGYHAIPPRRRSRSATSARRRRATSRSTRTCCSCRANPTRAASTAAARA